MVAVGFDSQRVEIDFFSSDKSQSPHIAILKRDDGEMEEDTYFDDENDDKFTDEELLEDKILNDDDDDDLDEEYDDDLELNSR